MNLIGESRRIREIRDDIRCFARHDIPVLILGETGTGKDVAATLCHQYSDKGGRLVYVNCTSLSDTLVESELFGHVRGAFTGAVTDRAGLIATADGGTLFLDEIGDMPLRLQASLLHAIEHGKFRNVGSDDTQRSDFRLICATNRELSKLTECGRFRSDLYYRIAGVEIRMPALRTIADDIPLLANHFLHDRIGKRTKFSDAAIAKIHDYDWPGNARQLFNAVRYAVAKCKDAITIHDLPQWVCHGRQESD